MPLPAQHTLTHTQVTIKGCTGPVNTFVIEPFVPHKEEFYLCIQSNRLDIEVGSILGVWSCGA
jgi:hypothetical protein